MLSPAVIQELRFISQLVEILDMSGLNITELSSDDEEVVLEVLEHFFCGNLSVDDSALRTLFSQHKGTEEAGKVSAFIAYHWFVLDA